MRPNRTLPAALAALAALLAGCVEEGELAPAWDAAVEALVEEVEGGLLAGGSPLADLADEWWCETKEECDEKCDEMGGNPIAKRPVCICVWSTRREAFSCQHFGGGGDGDKWPKVPGMGIVKIGDPNDPSRDPGRPGGGGGDDGDDDDEERELSFGCDEGVERGADGGCEVKANFPMDSLEFSWVSGSNSSKGQGEGYASWEGTATGDRGVLVTIVGEGEQPVLLVGEVTVSPRKWKLPLRSATERYMSMSWDSMWGMYESGDLDTLLEKTKQGSGPWKGAWILDGQPEFDGAAWLAVNSKFVDSVEYALADSTCGLAEGSSVSVSELNVHCKTWDNMEAFRRVVLAHERKHEASLNKCIAAANTDGRLAAVEAIVKTREADAKTEAETLWTDGLLEAILDARETDQSAKTSEDPFWWRYDVWRRGLHRMGGHDGTDGCP